MQTIQQQKALKAHHHPTCSKCGQDELVESLRGSKLWESLMTPLAKIAEQVRALRGAA